MIELIGQIRPDTVAFPRSRTGTGSSADPAAAETLKDRYIAAGEQPPYSGIYSRESLLAGAETGQTGEELDEDGLDSRIFEQEEAELAKTPNELDEGDKELVQRLQARDLEVRMHEQSHAAAAGKYARGAPAYSYQRGPDGNMYAIGGSIAVDVGKEASAAENNSKSAILQAAAMGVADPSSADAMVSAQAARLMGQGIEVQA